MMATEKSARVGLTLKGLKLYLNIRSAFFEFAVPATHPETGEEGFISSPASFRAAVRRFKDLWGKEGFARELAREEVLMELALRPRTLRELYKALNVSSKDARRAVRELMEAGLVTDDDGEMFIQG